MNSKKKNSQTTSGTHKEYKPGQLVTICKDVFRIIKNISDFTDCYMCDLNLYQQEKWCSHCVCNRYLKLIKKHKG